MTTSETTPVKPDTKRTVPPHLIVPSKRAHEMLVQALDDLLTEAEATQPHETSYMRAAKKALSVARGESSDDQTQPLPLCEDPWRLTRHLPGFRPLRDGEEWHRQDFTEDMLAGGWRPHLMGEHDHPCDEKLPSGRWVKCEPIFIGSDGRDYFRRTRRPLPEPAKVVPWGGQDDFPVNCWLRHKHSPELHYWPVLVAPLGVRVFCPQEHILSWQLLADCYQHSFDCKTWLPCTKEVAP